jgi:protein-tyrosine-phosphatase
MLTKGADGMIKELERIETKINTAWELVGRGFRSQADKALSEAAEIMSEHGISSNSKSKKAKQLSEKYNYVLDLILA